MRVALTLRALRAELDPLEGLLEAESAIAVAALRHDLRGTDALVERHLASLADQRLVHALLLLVGALAVELTDMHRLLVAMG